MNRIRHFLLGPALPTQQYLHERLNKVRALATFSPDALSSLAYANQEIYLGLVAAGAAGLALSWPIGLAITILLVIVALSYYQTIEAYPSGGGSYIVALENLGTLPGLVAGAALLVDYILTAAVSLTAGVEAIASAFPVLWEHRVAASLCILLLLTILNLRGLRETGTIMSVPVYLFLAAFFPLLLFGFYRALTGGPFTYPEHIPSAAAPLSLILILRTFSAGCTALTGIEAVSNGVQAFHPPESKNARKTLIIMALLMAFLFLGSIGLIHALAIAPNPSETILSALARRVLGTGPAYFTVQVATMLVLAVAANTSFAGFPRLAALLAKDSFMPHQFTGLGDRLVLANGILFLSSLTAVLIIGFSGNTHALIPLFAIGAFLAFTLSQAGMVLHWIRARGRGWQVKAFLNGLGALATGLTVVVVGISKFLQGAWLTILIIPALVHMFFSIRRHYADIAQELRLTAVADVGGRRSQSRIVIPISSVHRGVADALDYAASISDNVTAAYIELEPGSGENIREKWQHFWPEIPLVILPSPYRSIVGPLLDYLDEVDAASDDGTLAAVVIPEFVPVKWWHSFLHNQTAWLLKAALLYRRRHLGFQRVIIDVPFHLNR